MWLMGVSLMMMRGRKMVRNETSCTFIESGVGWTLHSGEAATPDKSGFFV